jgi:hypothetical protein
VVSYLIDAYPDVLNVVEVHVNEDGYEIPWGDDRFANFYGLIFVPAFILDGYEEAPSGYYEDGVLAHLDEHTYVTIDLSASEAGDATWVVTARVCVEAGGFEHDLRIWIVEVLDYYPASPDYSRNTLRQVASPAYVTLDAGECTDVSSLFAFDPDSWSNRENIRIIAWAEDPTDGGPTYVHQSARMTWPFPSPPAAEPELPRDFRMSLPLFGAEGSAWVEDATEAAVLPESDDQIQATYQVLCGDTTGLYPLDNPPTTDWPFADITFDEYTMPIFRAGSGQQEVLLCDYEGMLSYPNVKWDVDTEGGPIAVPSCSGTVRPSGPIGPDSDGHLILFDPQTQTSYDFWQATTLRDGECDSKGGGLSGESILEAGYADFFAVTGDGVNPAGVASARATGTPLLAGMILPEDVESGAIEHALAVAIPGPRNLSSDPYEPLASDYFYPAATTETDMYSVNPYALAAGQRLRLKPTLVNDEGLPVSEGSTAVVAPITGMFIDALRTYGAYVVDNASGFTFYAEDIHTATLDLGEDQVNALIGSPSGTPLPPDRTKWQVVIERLNQDLEGIPFAYGTCDGAQSTVTTANFEVVEPASMATTCIEPSISADPESTIVIPGDSTTLEVVATGTQPLTYQWYEGVSGDTAAPIAGATADTYTTPPLEENANYWVRVSNECGTADSTTAEISVGYPPRRARGRHSTP